MIFLAAGPVMSALSKSPIKLRHVLLAAPPLYAGAAMGTRSAEIRDRIIGNHDEDRRPLAASANADWASMPGMAASGTLAVAGVGALTQAGRSKLAGYAGMTMLAAGIGGTMSMVGWGNILEPTGQLGYDLARKGYNALAPGPNIPDIDLSFNFEMPDVGNAFRELVTWEEQIKINGTHLLEPGEAIDVRDGLGELPTELREYEVIEHPGFPGGPVPSEIRNGEPLPGGLK